MPITMAAGTSSDPAGPSKVRIIHPQAVEWVWPDVREIMREHPEGLLDGFVSEEGVLTQILSGQIDLWLGLDSLVEGNVDFVGLCRFEQFEAFSLYRVLWVGGHFMPHLEDAVAQVSTYAREVVKADKLALDGRYGWLRTMERFDFEVVRYEMWKPLARSN